jgi:hypothetical protein
MAGLDPAIHVFDDNVKEGVDTRVKPAHDVVDRGVMGYFFPSHRAQTLSTRHCHKAMRALNL